MATSFVNSREGGIHCVGASDESGEYVLWQVGTKDLKESVYFEYDDQSNGGYDIVTAVTVMRDGIHIELTSKKMVHYYFSMSRQVDAQYAKFVQGLEEIYRTNPAILEVQR